MSQRQNPISQANVFNSDAHVPMMLSLPLCNSKLQAPTPLSVMEDVSSFLISKSYTVILSSLRRYIRACWISNNSYNRWPHCRWHVSSASAWHEFHILLTWPTSCILRRTEVVYVGRPMDLLMKVLCRHGTAFSSAQHCLDGCQQQVDIIFCCIQCLTIIFIFWHLAVVPYNFWKDLHSIKVHLSSWLF